MFVATEGEYNKCMYCCCRMSADVALTVTAMLLVNADAHLRRYFVTGQVAKQVARDAPLASRIARNEFVKAVLAQERVFSSISDFSGNSGKAELLEILRPVLPHAQVAYDTLFDARHKVFILPWQEHTEYKTIYYRYSRNIILAAELVPGESVIRYCGRTRYMLNIRRGGITQEDFDTDVIHPTRESILIYISTRVDPGHTKYQFVAWDAREAEIDADAELQVKERLRSWF